MNLGLFFKRSSYLLNLEYFRLACCIICFGESVDMAQVWNVKGTHELYDL